LYHHLKISLSLSLSLPSPFSLRYLDYIREMVYRSLPQAQLGGVPGTRQLVKSYLNLVPSLVGVDPGSPWRMVFYCMRCGDLQDALDIVKRNQ
jgi:nuclear pore complex protein Nup93